MKGERSFRAQAEIDQGAVFSHIDVIRALSGGEAGTEGVRLAGWCELEATGQHLGDREIRHVGFGQVANG